MKRVRQYEDLGLQGGGAMWIRLDRCEGAWLALKACRRIWTRILEWTDSQCSCWSIWVDRGGPSDDSGS